MDILKNKQTKSYSSISRYSSFSLYYNKLDNKYIYQVMNQLNTETPFVAIKLEKNDTLESLALKYYGRPDLYWVIAWYNNINDPYIKLYNKFTNIKVPTLSSIEFEDN